MAEPQTITQRGDTCLLGYIDLLVKNGLVKNEDLALLKSKYLTCEDLYLALETLGVIDLRKLTELFAKSKGIPYVDVKDVDKRAYEMVSSDLVKDFSFIPFSVNDKEKILQVAIADPLKLAKVSQASLRLLEKKIGYKIELFLTSKNVIGDLPLLVSDGNQLPSVELKSYWIDDSILRKIPYDLAFKYKVIIFRQVNAKEYDVAVANPTDRSILLMLDQMEKKAGIKFNIFTSTSSDLDKVLKNYRERNEARARRIEDERKAREEADKAIEKAAIAAKKESDKAKEISLKESQVKIEPKVSIEEESKPPAVNTKEEAKGEENNNQSKEETSENSILNFKIDGAKEEGEAGGQNTESEKNDFGELNRLEDPDLTKIIGNEVITVEKINSFASAGNIPQLVASVISAAIAQEASDIHIEPFEKNVRLRYRVDGQLADISQFPPQIQPQIAARIKILSKLKLDEQRVPQDGRFDAKSGKEIVDIRVSTLPTVFGEKVVMRLLSKTKKLDDLQDLGIEGMNYDRIVEAISKPYGVVLATGPTGSGKSTSLYSIFSRLNKPEVNIITLEDPVEYEIPGINQVQVKPQIGFSFAEGLRSVLRQDPNIIMVGEIRDGETAELAVQAALTGHLVFSTLHTNDASSALPRMYNLGVEPFLLTSAVNAVVGQRLVRRVCPKCRQEVTLPQSIVFQVKKELEPLNLNIPIKFYKGKGCPECKEGFKGRLGIYEVLKMSKEIEDLVLDKKSASEIFAQATKSGMISMKQDGLIKAIKGATTVDEVLRVTREQNEEG